jgi:hypothetical protein
MPRKPVDLGSRPESPNPSDFTPVREDTSRFFALEKALAEQVAELGLPLMMETRPPTASTRPSTANASEATPSRLARSPEHMREFAAYPPLDAIGMPPFPAIPQGYAERFLAKDIAAAFSSDMGGFPRPMTTPPDFLRVESPPVTSDREQICHDLKGRVVEFSKSQVGSRYLQRQLRKDSPELVGLIVVEVLGALPELMCDTYGNYLCQQLFEACTPPLRLQILERLMPCFREISCDRRGTHALQALMGEAMTRDERRIISHGLRGSGTPGESPLVVQLAFDAHGTHVIQRMLLCFDSESSEFIYNCALPVLEQLAQHPYGLCVVKKCIARASESQKQRIIKKLSQHAIDLVVSPYGNYAIQAALEAWGSPACRSIVLKFRGRILSLAVQKFSSNVVEKCVAIDPGRRSEMIDELIGGDRSGVHVLMESQYGMYVIQKALPHATSKQLNDLKHGIQRHVGSLNRKMRAKWEKLLNQLEKSSGPGRDHSGATSRAEPPSFF